MAHGKHPTGSPPRPVASEHEGARGLGPLVPGTWTLDHSHSMVGFSIRHLGVSKVRGRFREFEAVLTAGSTPETSSVTATVQLASIDTANDDRDATVRGPGVLEVERRPTMSFASDTVTGAGSAWQVDGVLTIGSVSRPLSLDVDFGGVETHIDGRRHAGFEATGELRRKDFDIALGPAGAVLGDVVKIELDLQFVEPAGAPR